MRAASRRPPLPAKNPRTGSEGLTTTVRLVAARDPTCHSVGRR
jgi:hypothetical protein